jgi:hypothetical protein
LIVALFKMLMKQRLSVSWVMSTHKQLESQEVLH